MAVLIDSTVWIDWLRKRQDPRAFIKPWVMRRACFTCGIIKIEVLRGVLIKAQRDKVEEMLNALEDIPLSNELLANTAKRAWELDRKGKVLSLSDLVIAECTRKADAWLFTYDRDFQLIPELKLTREMPKLK